MAQTLEAIRGGGGSVKLGTIGTVSALMSRELDSTKSTSANVPSVDEASSSTSNFKNHKLPENTKRTTKNQTRTTTQIPMLKSDDTISTDGTPIRQKKSIKKGPAGIVEIVDIKCGSSDKKWVNPIKHRLKKLGFSKLSHSIV
ncbi:hypothetical protein ABFX02_08G175500 [Erythranthe guttata]